MSAGTVTQHRHAVSNLLLIALIVFAFALAVQFAPRTMQVGPYAAHAVAPLAVVGCAALPILCP